MKTVIDKGYGTMVEIHEAVFISGNIPSSKNSKVATSKGVFHSKTVTKWLREQGIQHYSVSKKEITYYKTRPCVFPVEELSQLLSASRGEKPVKIGVHFVYSFHLLACSSLPSSLVRRNTRPGKL